MTLPQAPGFRLDGMQALVTGSALMVNGGWTAH